MTSRPVGGSTALKRLMTEYKELALNPPEGITAGPVSEDNFFVWEALIPYVKHILIADCITIDCYSGPTDTAYEGGLFTAILTFPRDYPLNPPTMKFTCDMFHPNGKGQ